VRLKNEESKRLAIHLTNLITSDKSVTLKVPRSKIQDTIEYTLTRHFDEEKQIEQEAERLYQERAHEFGAQDKAKALMMLRRQLAKEKEDFVLSGGSESRFSEDKIIHMSHLVADRLYDDDLLDFVDEDEGPKYVKRVFKEYFHKEDEARDRVRKKIQSMSNAPFEGSRDFDVLQKKFMEEELRRLGH
jgi:uncharacterized protein